MKQKKIQFCYYLCVEQFHQSTINDLIKKKNDDKFIVLQLLLRAKGSICLSYKMTCIKM